MLWMQNISLQLRGNPFSLGLPCIPSDCRLFPKCIVCSQSYSLRTADAFLVVASLPSKSEEAEMRRPEMRLLFAGYQSKGSDIIFHLNEKKKGRGNLRI